MSCSDNSLTLLSTIVSVRKSVELAFIINNNNIVIKVESRAMQTKPVYAYYNHVPTKWIKSGSYIHSVSCLFCLAS